MGKGRKETKLIRFVKRALNVINKARIPLRSSKFSNKIYNNHVHLILHMLRVSSKRSYQRFFEWIENFTQLWKVLAISKIPHFTTLHKFTQRCPKRYMDAFIQMSGLLDDNLTISTAIDSTGFSLTNASFHYTVVIRILHKSQRKPGIHRIKHFYKRFLKATFIVDTDTQLVLATSIRRGPGSDYKDFPKTYDKLNGSVDIGLVLGDKGYDSEANHEYVHDVLGAESIFPPRKNKSHDFATRGKYRKKMRAGYDLAKYRQRNMVETVNSVIKRKMGDHVRNRKVLYQNREILYMVMVYNIERGLNYISFILIGFLESLSRNPELPIIFYNSKGSFPNPLFQNKNNFDFNER